MLESKDMRASGALLKNYYVQRFGLTGSSRGLGRQLARLFGRGKPSGRNRRASRNKLNDSSRIWTGTRRALGRDGFRCAPPMPVQTAIGRVGRLARFGNNCRLRECARRSKWVSRIRFRAQMTRILWSRECDSRRAGAASLRLQRSDTSSRFRHRRPDRSTWIKWRISRRVGMGAFPRCCEKR